ncbi:uncharacterized protein FOMMEDRAFT_20426 [Fomitiporia mediterranea MF3/22]|uniref:uncharacterized protein n=1 Tax=Fomitiporia mediterranea (strain MF3/22) TaxID=694068 RepID=UPI000440923D|nr:uncharacterized protein FOMMEDRAFT_20426 [Fomitiporia mediterranea MF3/22]EJD03277.1 hypothetical protein FOMMEDRAFT_20426 [Fomitiporia mediterranea MF3/22]
MVVTRTGSHNPSHAMGLRSVLRKSATSEGMARKLDGLGYYVPTGHERINNVKEGMEKYEGEDEEELEKEENDVDDETLRNTHANEHIMPKRLLRRRASSKMASSPSCSGNTCSPHKHVMFVV